MNDSHSSDTNLRFSLAEPNAEASEEDNDLGISKLSRQTSERDSSLSKQRPLSRKPQSRNSNFQTYKTMKRKSQEKGQRNSQEVPPKYPKPSQEEKQQQSMLEPASTIVGSSPSQTIGNGEKGKFKKKALTKEEVIEIKGYMAEFQRDSSEVGSVAATEKALPFTDVGSSMKEMNKKSKTQYFHIEDFQKHQPIQNGESENLSESEKNYLASLKNKCKTVDENNSLLQKRISWLREEVEMHLQRQAQFEKEKSCLLKQLKEKDAIIKGKQHSHTLYAQNCRNEIQKRDGEIGMLKELLVNLRDKFEYEKELLIEQAQSARNDKDAEQEEKQKQLEEKVVELQARVRELSLQKRSADDRAEMLMERQASSEALNQRYSSSFVEKLMSENKYLKVENHTLARLKDELAHLQRDLKRVSNERDNLKKKIIEQVKLSMKRYRKGEEEDSEENSSELFALSQLSVSSPPQLH